MQGRLLTTICVLFCAACSSHSVSSPSPNRSISSSGPMEHVFSRLREKGANEPYLRLLKKNYREEERLRVLDLNLLGFLKPRAEQPAQVPGWELERIEKFIGKNRLAFIRAEKKYQVPKEVIASLLWVETRHGKDIGRFHVPSAFLSIAQADYPTILDQTMDVAKDRANPFTADIEKKVIERSKRKSDWAVGELMALQQLHEQGKNVFALEGSFSGAFGMAQFLPSSYASWAKGSKEQPNLFSAHDAIHSVGNYLKTNGWKRKEKETHQTALFHYNNDRNYVNRILHMSECLRSPAKKKLWRTKTRRLASTRSC
jgi:membrane-bound lytic murein transglycosylase B